MALKGKTEKKHCRQDDLHRRDNKGTEKKQIPRTRVLQHNKNPQTTIKIKESPGSKETPTSRQDHLLGRSSSLVKSSPGRR